MKKEIQFSLAYQIFIGLILGIIVGFVYYDNPVVSMYLQAVGTTFIDLIKMLVVPIIVSTLIVGVASMGDLKQMGKLGGKTVLYFQLVSLVAIVVGLSAANLFKPGEGLDLSSLAKSDIDQYVGITESEGLMDIIVGIVPDNVIEAMVSGDMLSIIFFCVLFGLGLASIGERGKPVIGFFQAASDVMFFAINFMMKFAPIGVFALIGAAVSKFGLESLIPLGKLVILFYVTMVFFVVVVLGGIAKLVGSSIFSIVKDLKDELFLAYSTSSSETVLPKLMEKMEKMGSPREIVSFVIPTGYSFNLGGSRVYQALAAIFIAQLYGIDLSMTEQITFVLVLMITSNGITGVPGLSFVVLLATLGTVGIPLEGLAFIVGIDRLLDMGRTVVNVLGNALATIVIAKWEGRFNTENAKSLTSIGKLT